MPALVFALVLTISLPAMVSAQDRPAPRDPLPNFAIPMRGEVQLPRIGLPPPSIGLQPHERVHKPARHRRHRGFVGAPWVVYVMPEFLELTPEESGPAVPEEPSTGRLILDVEPATAEVFAGGIYLGTPEDVGAASGGAILEVGVHRIEISAPGYDPVTLLASIRPNQSTTYRRVLERIEPVPSPPADADTAPTFYVIPGCYMGNVPPKVARLPATCDISKAITVQP